MKALCSELMSACQTHMHDELCDTPFAAHAAQYGHEDMAGGKVDDATLLVASVFDSEQRAEEEEEDASDEA